MTNKILTGIVTLFLFVFAMQAHQGYCESHQYAREKLRKEGISYTKDKFIQEVSVGNTNIVRLFLEAGMDPDTKNTEGQTALVIASEKGYTEIVKILLQYKTYVNTGGKKERKIATASMTNKEEYGALLIGGLPAGAKVSIDGGREITAGKEGIIKVGKLMAGGHIIACNASGYKAYSKQIQIAKGEQTALTIRLEALPGILTVQGSPNGAEVYIDGTKSGVIPYNGSLSVGQHSVEIKASGYTGMSKAVTIASSNTTRIDVALKIKPQPGMVYIPAGWFWMGCSPNDNHCHSNEKPYHRVYLDAYFIDKNDVTVDEYTRCVNAGGCTNPNTGESCNWGVSGMGNNPINCVDWNQATAYCQWAGKKLPTEAQWEKAARGTDGRIYPWGNDWDASKACFNQQSTCAVGSYPQGASPYGVLDMAGNVYDWCSDWDDDNYYSSSPDHNPQGPDSGTYRVLRGCSWYDVGPTDLRSSDRFGGGPTVWNHGFGFRCVR